MSHHPTSLRIRPEQLARIDELAQHHHLSRNAFMIKAALGELNPVSIADERLDDLEQRLQRLESFAYNT